VLGVAVKSNAFTFGLLLCFYLTGLGLGAVAGGVWARRSRSPVAAFFALQAGIVASGLIGAELRHLLCMKAASINGCPY